MKFPGTIFSFVFSVGISIVHAANMDSLSTPCQQDKARLELRSEELAAIVKADQDDRDEWKKMSQAEMVEVVKRDVLRRKRVGEIFGEGCFSKAKDYAFAALVFQHGDVPEHFFQTFIWAKRAVELGDTKQKRMMALGIDRYLVNSGHKQLFGSQVSKPDSKPETCWCLEQVEKTYPDDLRKEFADQTLAEAFDWLKELNAGTKCPIAECATPLKPTPKGTVPGFW